MMFDEKSEARTLQIESLEDRLAPGGLLGCLCGGVDANICIDVNIGLCGCDLLSVDAHVSV